MFLIRVILILPAKLLWWFTVSVWLNICDAMALPIYAYRKMRDKSTPTHGDAAFATLKTLRDRGHLKQDGWLIGIVEKKRVYTAAEACVLGAAPRRTGKSLMASAQLRDLAERERKADIVVVDPHGDLRRMTEAYFVEKGFQTRTIDFTRPQASEKYNVTSVMRPLSKFNFDRDIDQFLKLVMPDDKKSSNDHFPAFARIMMAGATSYMMRTEAGTVTLSQVVERLTGNIQQRNEMFSAMRAAGNAVERLAMNAFEEASSKERGSFSTTLARKLNIWLRESFRHITSEGEWTWEDVFLSEAPTVTYIKAGAGADEGAAARLILGNAINTRGYMWDDLQNSYTGRGRPKFPRELRILVDEARLIGNCSAIVDAVTQLGKADVTVILWFLAMRDVYDIYPEASVITNSCNTIAFGGGTEMSFYEDFSRTLGDRTIENPGYSEGEHGTSQSANEQARRLMKADELQRMDRTKLAAILGDLSIFADKPARPEGDEVRYL
ncbi:type IV secretory system conjugative DNA transfer family protein [Rhizobium leguminosarum]|uniref:type IV secretory system conjugative DNA transfer family protein n=1 Tax=Rhizobium leguminosarum TaxID=384 RepID=UPI001C96CE3B|nr:type IV secretory system conjugative DNA transfer family protein [Rhizobium leguminosarum]MBY5594088.1 type IV secretory system conjugative DNA transfer family protein [Rhizobium leguminosarum]